MEMWCYLATGHCHSHQHFWNLGSNMHLCLGLDNLMPNLGGLVGTSWEWMYTRNCLVGHGGWYKSRQPSVCEHCLTTLSCGCQPMLLLSLWLGNWLASQTPNASRQGCTPSCLIGPAIYSAVGHCLFASRCLMLVLGAWLAHTFVGHSVYQRVLQFPTSV